MLDKDQSQDQSFQFKSPLNNEGIVDREVAFMPTHGLSCLCGIPKIELSFEAFDMPKVPFKLLPYNQRGVREWEVAMWEGKQIFRGCNVSANGRRFAFFVPTDFPIETGISVEDQCKYYASIKG